MRSDTVQQTFRAPAHPLLHRINKISCEYFTLIRSINQPMAQLNPTRSFEQWVPPTNRLKPPENELRENIPIHYTALSSWLNGTSNNTIRLSRLTPPDGSKSKSVSAPNDIILIGWRRALSSSPFINWFGARRRDPVVARRGKRTATTHRTY